jgi:hypothetical protein
MYAQGDRLESPDQGGAMAVDLVALSGVSRLLTIINIAVRAWCGRS